MANNNASITGRKRSKHLAVTRLKSNLILRFALLKTMIMALTIIEAENCFQTYSFVRYIISTMYSITYVFNIVIKILVFLNHVYNIN